MEMKQTIPTVTQPKRGTMKRCPTAKQLVLIVGLLIGLTACASDDESEDTSISYTTEEAWLCKPGISSDLCLELDQTATWIKADSSFETVQHSNANNPDFDCFYVYPTVDMGSEPGNTEDLTDTSLILTPLYNQVSRFTRLCNVYAPRYHQMTIGTYDVEGGYRDSEYFDTAYGNIEQAFNQYLSESGDRPFVLMGHSQGSHVLIRLLEEHFDADAELRKRLISALLIGPVGSLEVPEGQTTGGTFETIPLCSIAGEVGCIISYDSIAAGGIDDRDSAVRPCVNPTLLGGDAGVLAVTYWASDNGMPFSSDITDPWVAYPLLHTATCEADGYLGIGTVVGSRVPAMTPEALQLLLGETLHVADVNFALGDLLRIVETQAATF
jgi:pimeloyl-ACP methyl ester carboxylesterase